MLIKALNLNRVSIAETQTRTQSDSNYRDSTNQTAAKPYRNYQIQIETRKQRL